MKFFAIILNSIQVLKCLFYQVGWYGSQNSSSLPSQHLFLKHFTKIFQTCQANVLNTCTYTHDVVFTKILHDQCCGLSDRPGL